MDKQAKAIELEKDFNQVCIWPGTMVINKGPEEDDLVPGSEEAQKEIEEFTKFMKKEMRVRVQYLHEIKTGPDQKRGGPVPETGGRNDLFFAIHDDDVSLFSIQRLPYGIRWIEDALDNNPEIYPEWVKDYRTW